MQNIYQLLAAHLDKLPIPFPSTETGFELEILKKWFSQKHAKIALKMKGIPEPVSIIADRLGESEETLAPVLEKMSKMGLIFRMVQANTRETGSPIWLYNIVPIAEGLWEFHMNSLDNDEVKMVDDYMEFFMEKAWYKTKTSQHRVVPISKSIQAEMEIFPYDHAEEIIKSQTKISVAHCICRKQAGMLGKGCDHPSEVCMAFGAGAYYYIENGLGRSVSQEEALKILHQGMEAGLVVQPGNGQRVWSMCLCCSCSCKLLRSLKKNEKPSLMAHTNFYAVCIKDDCTACGLCVERCPMAAIELKDTAVVDNDRCIGCGVCIGACDFSAMVLQQKKISKQYLPPKDVTDMQIRVVRERGMI